MQVCRNSKLERQHSAHVTAGDPGGMPAGHLVNEQGEAQAAWVSHMLALAYMHLCCSPWQLQKEPCQSEAFSAPILTGNIVVADACDHSCPVMNRHTLAKSLQKLT